LQERHGELKALLPTWLIQTVEDELQQLLQEQGYVRMVEELGEVSGAEVIEWVKGEQELESISLTIRPHGETLSLVEVSWTSPRSKNIFLLAVLKVLRSCVNSIMALDRRLEEALSKMLSEIDSLALSISEEF
jgi:hypothetical protein